ncbi:MAG: DUF3644 domain-containing protein, partial [Phycisphaerales bacterium]|nr:DUF3644 domain-containing protein [Phycisphaerales bacterium]
NRKGQADRVIEFVKSDSPLADKLNAEYAVIRETEKPKYLPKQIVELMHNEGFLGFTMHNHTKLWQSMGAKNPGKGFGTMVSKKYWHWYSRWVDEVRKHCTENREMYE